MNFIQLTWSSQVCGINLSIYLIGININDVNSLLENKVSEEGFLYDPSKLKVSVYNDGGIIISFNSKVRN